ncbi:MAG: hypothetical protein II359_07850, partial [Clostridia bacterium]|nr:hypothetical protein [Clostridia bacterium]
MPRKIVSKIPDTSEIESVTAGFSPSIFGKPVLWCSKRAVGCHAQKSIKASGGIVYSLVSLWMHMIDMGTAKFSNKKYRADPEKSRVRHDCFFDCCAVNGDKHNF